MHYRAHRGRSPLDCQRDVGVGLPMSRLRGAGHHSRPPQISRLAEDQSKQQIGSRTHRLPGTYLLNEPPSSGPLTAEANYASQKAPEAPYHPSPCGQQVTPRTGPASDHSQRQGGQNRGMGEPCQPPAVTQTCRFS